MLCLWFLWITSEGFWTTYIPAAYSSSTTSLFLLTYGLHFRRCTLHH
jgi:hypothetical protein